MPCEISNLFSSFKSFLYLFPCPDKICGAPNIKQVQPGVGWYGIKQLLKLSAPLYFSEKVRLHLNRFLFQTVGVVLSNAVNNHDLQLHENLKGIPFLQCISCLSKGILRCCLKQILFWEGVCVTQQLQAMKSQELT